MKDLFGIILLDGNEVIIRTYLFEKGTWKLLEYQNYDLTPFEKNKQVTSADIIEVIAEVSLSRTVANIAEWKICARNIEEITLHDIATVTGIDTELFTLNREQELLCKGILLESNFTIKIASPTAAS
jgi:hypothetical protein